MNAEQTQLREKLQTQFHKWWDVNNHPSLSRGLALSTWIAASYEALEIKDPVTYARDVQPKYIQIVDIDVDDLLGVGYEEGDEELLG